MNNSKAVILVSGIFIGAGIFGAIIQPTSAWFLAVIVGFAAVVVEAIIST